ncbi:MAG: acetyl-CoA carboxylase carboxyl transferase subunit beta [Clostridia bacterium]|nr:acetyl-CoA carboxylase carboxyl transferase subunit beta [Clostridia bacterium]
MALEAMTARARLEATLDAGTACELFEELCGGDPLSFPGYMSKLEAQREKTGMREALICAQGEIDGMRAAVCVLDGGFFMGSMGYAVGEKVARCAEYAMAERLPLIIFSASGGARMQEGVVSLMQMAKTSAAIERFKNAGGLFISVLTHPTTGGVAASFASLGDIMLAEPDALIGFAGPRVIEQTIGQTLPEGFQRSEFQQEHGFVDQIVPREEMKKTLSQLLRLHGFGKSEVRA